MSFSRDERKSALETGEARADGNDRGNNDDELRKGMAIEVCLKSGGKAKWLKGKILYARFNGTFDIQLAGGKRENGLEKRLIRKLERDYGDDTNNQREVGDTI